MKLQRTTLGLVVFALFLGTFVYFVEVREKPKKESLQAKQKQIFTFKVDEVKKLTVDKSGKILEFERSGKDGKSWQMKQPENTAASEPEVSFLLNLVVPGKKDRSFDASGDRLKDYGLDKPSARITMHLKDGKTHQLILGNPDFQNEFMYARVNSEPEIMLVPKDLKLTIEKEPDEWKQKEKTGK